MWGISLLNSNCIDMHFSVAVSLMCQTNILTHFIWLMHVENERSLVVGKMVVLAFADLSHFCAEAQTTVFWSLCYMCMPSAARSQPSSDATANAKTTTSFTPTLGGALLLCNMFVLTPLVSTYQYIWPFPLSAPWRASASPLTSWGLRGEERCGEDV